MSHRGTRKGIPLSLTTNKRRSSDFEAQRSFGRQRQSTAMSWIVFVYSFIDQRGMKRGGLNPCIPTRLYWHDTDCMDPCVLVSYHTGSTQWYHPLHILYCMDTIITSNSDLRGNLPNSTNLISNLARPLQKQMI